MSKNISGLTIPALLWLGMALLHAQTRSTAPKTAPAQGSTPPAAQQPASKLPSQTAGSAHENAPLALPDLTASSDGIVIGGQRVPWGGSVTLYAKPNAAGGSAGSDDKAGNVIFQPSPSAGGVAKQGGLLKQKDVLHEQQNKLDSTVRDPAQPLSCRFPYAFTAQNIGGGPLPPSVFYLLSTEDGRGLAGGTSPNARLDPLGPGQQKKVSGEIDLPGGLHILRLALDHTRQLNELNRANNEFQITVNVNCGPSKDKAVTGAMAPSPKGPHMSATRNLVADIGGWEARVKARGLDPKDPNLSSKLAKLATESDRQFRSVRTVSALRILPLQRPSLINIPSQAQHLIPPANSRRALDSTMSQASNRRATAHVTQPFAIRNLLVNGQPTSELDGSRYDLHYEISGNWDKFFPVPTETTYDDTRDLGAASIDLGSCGVVDLGFFFFVPNSTDGIAMMLWPAFGVYQRSIPGNTKRPRPGVLTVNLATGPVSNAIKLTNVIPTPASAVASIAIAATNPHLTGDGGIGFQTSNIALAGNGDRVSTAPENQGGHGGSGTDIIGRGIYLMNGYTATARIVSAHSYMDAPNYSQPDDSYRGATIAQQPQSGRLETHVAWHYAAGESIDYVIEWELKGTYGVRPLSTMPRPGTCGD